MARDIEEFLRRAAERRKQQQQQQSSSQPPQRQSGGTSPPRRTARPASPTPVVEQVEVVREKPRHKTLREQSVVEHVASHINTSDISQHTAQLGSEIRESDEHVKSRLKQSFDHAVGGLGGRETITDDRLAESMGDDVTEFAFEIFEMLTSQNGIRNAILAAEILRRPDFDD